MPLTLVPMPYGMRDIKGRNFTDPGQTTPGAVQDFPYARTLSWTESEDFVELRGDDQTITTRGKGASVAWSMENGGLSYEQLKIMAGGNIISTGITPNQVKTFRKLNTDTRPFFKGEGQALSDSGGDVHAVLYRARVTGDITGEFGDGAFWLTGAKGVALGSNEVATLGALYDFVQNETVTAIV